MSSAADHISRLIQSMLKIPDSISSEYQAQPQISDQPSSEELALWTALKMRDNIINIITKRF